jgi:Mn2+/Fe2+ NRAMP family transporter
LNAALSQRLVIVVTLSAAADVFGAVCLAAGMQSAAVVGMSKQQLLLVAKAVRVRMKGQLHCSAGHRVEASMLCVVAVALCR